MNVHRSKTGYDGFMDPLSCEECRAIYLELREAIRSAPVSGTDDLGEWIRQLDHLELDYVRANSGIWKAWRRMQEHRVLTGHVVPVIAVSNPN
jgi:hypothetical protein